MWVIEEFFPKPNTSKSITAIENKIFLSRVSISENINIEDTTPIEHNPKKNINSSSHSFSYWNQEDTHLADWLSAVNSIKYIERSNRIDFDSWEIDFHKLLANQCHKSGWRNLLLQMDNVLSEYKYDYKKNKIHGQPPTMAEPAVWSILNLLHLIPFFTVHSPQLDIDADTGYFTAAFETAEQGVFSVLITDKNEVHCSWAEEGFNIVKFTGTFKIRDKRDFLKFKKILSIL